MKGLIIALALALIAAVAFLWGDERPDLPAPGTGEERTEEAQGAEDSQGSDRTAPELSAAQVPAVEEPAPAPVPTPEDPPAADWTPTRTEFLEAGLDELQIEVLLEGLAWVREHAPNDEGLAKAIEDGTVTDIGARAVQALGPKLAGLIEDGRLDVKCHERKEPTRYRVACEFFPRFTTGGKVDRFQFMVRGWRGVLVLAIPPRLLDGELVQAMEASRGR